MEAKQISFLFSHCAKDNFTKPAMFARESTGFKFFAFLCKDKSKLCTNVSVDQLS